MVRMKMRNTARSAAAETQGPRNRAPGPVLGVLAAIARQEELRDLAGQGALLLSAAAGAALLIVCADQLVAGGLSHTGLRVAFIVWLIAGLVGAGVVIGRAIVRRISLAHVAQRVERAADVRHNALVNAVLVDAADEAAYARDATLRQADAVLPGGDVALPLGRRARQVALLAAGVLAAWLVYPALSPKPVGVSVARFFGGNAPAPTATHIELLRPSATDIVHVGDAAEFEFEIAGAGAEAVRFTIAQSGAEEDGRVEIPLAERRREASGADRRVYRLAPFQVQTDIHFRCEAGDAVVSGVIPVHPTPQVAAVQIRLTPPAYTRRPAVVAESRALDVLQGTQATMDLTANTPLTLALYVFSDGRRETRTRLRLDSADAARGALTVVLNESGAYRFELTDVGGLTVAEPEAQRIVVRTDMPPVFRRVTLVGEASNDFVAEVVGGERWPVLEAIAEDEVGVEAMQLVVRVGDDERRQTLALESSEDGRRARAEADLNGLVPVLADGQAADAWFEARDGRVLPDGQAAPQTSASPTIQLVQRPRPRPDRGAPAPPAAETSASKPSAPPEPPSPPASQPAAGAESGEEPSPTDDPKGGETARPTNGAASQPARGQTGQSQPGEQPAGDNADAEDPVERFTREHGAEAEEAEQARRDGESSQDPNGTTPMPTSNPSSDDAKQTDGGSNGQSAQRGAGAGQSESGQSQPGPGASKPGENPAEHESDNGASAGSGQSQSDGEANGEQGSGQDADEGRAPNGAADGATNGGGATGGNRPGENGSNAGDPAARRAAAVARLVQAAERGEAVTLDELLAAGWPKEKASAFLRDLAKLGAAVRAAGGLEALRQRTANLTPGTPKLEGGARGNAPSVEIEGEDADRWQDALRRVAPPMDEQVPDELRGVLEAYYRSIARPTTRPASH